MQTIEKRPSKADRTRNFIIERSVDVFNKKGYCATSMSDVQAATGLSRGGLYGYFDNKGMVALAVFDHNLEKAFDFVSQRTKMARSFHDKLLVFAHVYQYVGNESTFTGGILLLNPASVVDDTIGLIRERVSRAIVKKERALANLIEMGILAGEFKKNVSSADMAHTIVSILEGGLLIASATNDPSKMDRIINTVDQMICQIRK
jgi:AcrR family transcriptional regulator